MGVFNVQRCITDCFANGSFYQMGKTTNYKCKPIDGCDGIIVDHKWSDHDTLRSIEVLGIDRNHNVENLIFNLCKS